MHLRSYRFFVVLPLAFITATLPFAGFAQESSPGSQAASATTEATAAATAPEFDPDAQIERARERRTSLQEQLETQQAAAAEAEDATAAAPINQRIEQIQALDLVYSQQISACERYSSIQEQVKQTQSELEKLRETPLEEPATFLEWNRLREQLNAEENRKDLVANQVKLAESAVEQAESTLEQRKSFVNQLQAKADSGEQLQAQQGITDMVAATLSVRAASATVQLRKIDLRNETLAQTLYQSQVKLLNARVDRLDGNVTFEEDELNDQLAKLDKEQTTLQLSLQKTQSNKPLIDKKYEATQSRLAQTPSPPQALQEDLNALRFEQLSNQERTDLLNSQLQWIPVRKTAWERRYQTFNKLAEETVLLTWKQESLNNINVLTQETNALNLKLDDYQSQLVTRRNNLNTLSDEASDARKHIEKQVQLLEQITSTLRERQSYVESVRRLQNKTIDEINATLSEQTWQERLDTLLKIEFYGNDLRRWTYSFGGAVIVFFLLYVIRWFILWRLRRLKDSDPQSLASSIIEVVGRIRPTFFFILALYIASSFLVLQNSDEEWINRLMYIALVLQVTVMAGYFVKQWIFQYLSRKAKRDETSMSAMAILNFISMLVIWSIAVMLVLQNLGYEITGLVTGLGIGGVAVALAVQRILGDLFASLSIVLDKPFVQGDFIIFDTFLGNVEQIGIKTTRIRSLTGEQIVCSNSDLLNARIRNFKRMHERRVVFALGVTYQTPAEKLETIPETIKEIIEPISSTRFDRAHFKEFGNFSLNFEIVYYVLTSDYAIYMDIQEEINLKIYRKFAEEGIEFAYPTQTVFVEGGDQPNPGKTEWQAPPPEANP